MRNWIRTIGYIMPMLLFMSLSPNAWAGTNKKAIEMNTQANGKKVTGIVRDDKGEAIIGASVVQKGTSNGTITDMDGHFALTVPSDAILEVSYIGYQKQQIKTDGQTAINVILQEDNRALDEVVVVGYGVQKKINLSGSVEALKGDNISKKATIQTSQALQGMAPGVTITTNSGKPGSEGASIRIRGIGTFNSNDPLVLVDGVASSVDAVDPNDIENISILKDAASASIYGSRAANGVILITTKHAGSQKVGITLRSSIGITKPLNRIHALDAWDYMALYDEANANDMRDDNGKPGGYIYGPDKINAWKTATDRDAYPNSDEWNETYKNSAMETQHYLGIVAGTDKFQSSTSLNYSWQDALYANTDYTRYGIRSNNTYKYNEYVEFGADLSMRNVKSRDAAAIGSFSTVDQLMRQPAIYPTRYSNGVWGQSYAGTPTEEMMIDEGLGMTYNEYTEALAKLSLIIKPFKGMRLDFWYAPKFNFHTEKQVTKNQTLYDYKTGDVIFQNVIPAYMNEQRWKDRTDDANILANYNTTIGKHDIALMGGFQYLKSSDNYLYAFRDNNNFPQYEEINSFDPTNQTNSGYTTEWALMSYFGRLNYSYDGKYILEANARYDGSSRFSKGHKWGFFPSFSGAWRFSSEKFMSSLPWWSNGKLRASWGKLGNQEGLGSNYPFALNVSTSQYGVFGNTLAQGYAPVNYALNDITWESTAMLDFGIDLGFFDNRLNVTFDWYKKNTNDILLTMAIPGVMGYANSPKQNAGKVENKGWDLTVSYNDKIGNVDYKVTGVLSDVLNKITDLGGLNPQVSGNHVNMVGEPINALYGYLADGYFSSFTEARASTVKQWGKLQGGDIKYIDVNGNGSMDGGDRQVIGNVIPRWTYSLDLYAAYKGFEVSAFFQGVGKRDSYMAG